MLRSTTFEGLYNQHVKLVFHMFFIYIEDTYSVNKYEQYERYELPNENFSKQIVLKLC